MESSFNEADGQFVLKLIQDAHLAGISMIEYRGLKVHLRPIPGANSRQPQSYATKWSSTLPIPRDNE